MLPQEVVFVPTHLARFNRLYASPDDLGFAVVGIQHDEKDVFRVLGPAGLQDLGDGEAQRLIHELLSCHRQRASSRTATQHAALESAGRAALGSLSCDSYLRAWQLHVRGGVQPQVDRKAFFLKCGIL